MAEYYGINIDEQNFSDNMKYIIDYTANVEHSEISTAIKNHVNNINNLYMQYKNLNDYSSAVQTIFINRYKYNNAIKELEKDFTPAAALHAVYENQTNKNREDALIESYLNSLRKWSLNSYKEIMSFRKFVTGGQELVYDFESGSSASYRLNEEQYLSLINEQLIFYYNTDWDSKTFEGNITEMLKLQVTSPKKIEDAEKVEIEKTKDFLYKYIYEQYAKNPDKANALTEARLYELYDQIRYSLFSKDVGYNKSVSEELFKIKEKQVANFASSYIEAKLHKDTTPFYQMGDAIENSMTLIENKRTGAVISIKTIINAIEKLHKIFETPQSKENLKKALKEMYIFQDKSDFGKKIQREAARVAAGGINRTVNEIKNIKILFS